ncbi:MAG: glycosyltransferase [Victivallales bacterium]|nr:glycosyltransferase [Victivallales bacterium]
MTKLKNALDNIEVNDWQDISKFLDSIKSSPELVPDLSEKQFSSLLSTGAAFVTYDFGIDGVSIEIFKYAECLEHIFPNIPLHFIGGDFHEKADIVLKDYWKRFEIDDFNGWSKWRNGKPFAKLFYDDMPENSEASRQMAREIWDEAKDFALKLGSYFVENNIKLAIPVNIMTNPGNVAAALGFIIAAEILDIYVISSNHDYYWEGGKPASEHKPGEKAGPRDHFFHNMANRSFFNLFSQLYPWNGQRWIQVNINTPQSRALVERFGFEADRVFELGTSISDKFFVHSTPEHTKSVRSRMNYIVSDGNEKITTVDIREHLADLSAWMQDEKPIACGNRSGLTLDLAADGTFYCLQPTRVILRKHIDRDEKLLSALLDYEPFAKSFFADSSKQLLLHVTGPTPIEHQVDLERVLKAYIALCDKLPEEVADRVFLVFSVGNENHPCFEKLNLEPLCIEAIYQLADIVLFPSETEGRGLPIIESSAGGIPIVCRRYYPEEVFDEVVGKGLPKEEQIKYVDFPTGEFKEDFLAKVAELLQHPEHFDDWREHNREAVKSRYSNEMIIRKFKDFFKILSR